MRSVTYRCLIYVLLLSLTACISYEEELWLDSDGSGRLHSTMGLSETLLDAKEGEGLDSNLDDLVAKLDSIGLELEEPPKEYSKAGKRFWSLKVRFDKVEDLAGLRGGDNDMALFGGGSITEDEDGNAVYTRVISFDDDKEDQSDEQKEMARGMMEAMFGGYTWKYTVHFPFSIASANAADEDIDREHDTVTWEYGLAQLMASNCVFR